MKSSVDGMLNPLSGRFGASHALNVLSKIALFEADFQDESKKITTVAIFKSDSPDTAQRVALLRTQLEATEFCHTVIKSSADKSKVDFDVIMQISAI